MNYSIDTQIMNSLEKTYRLHHSDKFKTKISEGIFMKNLLKVAVS